KGAQLRAECVPVRRGVLSHKWVIGLSFALALAVIALPRAGSLPVFHPLPADAEDRLIRAMEDAFEGSRFDRVSVSREGCRLRIRREDTAICEKGLPHPFTLFDQTIDLSLLEIEGFQVSEHYRGTPLRGYYLHIRYPRPLFDRMRVIYDDYRDLFALLDDQSRPRELPWKDAADRDAGIRAFLNDRVDGKMPMFSVDQTCDRTTWLRIPTESFIMELDGIPSDIAERQIRRMAADCRRN
ncbi:MAG: hypothetical protein WDA23_06735, partial [Gemmobacter sp.]